MNVGDLPVGARFRPFLPNNYYGQEKRADPNWFKKTAKTEDMDTSGPQWGNGNICLSEQSGGRVNFDPSVEVAEWKQ